MSKPKFKVGDQVETVTHSRVRRKERVWKFKVLEVLESDGSWFYRIDRRNFLSESMLRRAA